MDMSLDSLRSPVAFLEERLGSLPHREVLKEYEAWWFEGQAISDAVDQGGTPWLKMFDRFGNRVDEVRYPPEYWAMLRQAYEAGALWRVFEEDSILPFFLLSYVTAFHDPGLSCPHTVSLSTAIPLEKYGSRELKAEYLPKMLRKEGLPWQGATWMTEVKGGSDLGGAVETVAVPSGARWLLTGEKYFASNVGAELAVVAARPKGAPMNVRGLALFLLPKYRQDGSLNYTVRRIKDKTGTRSVPTGEVEFRESEAFLLGRKEQGVYLILEVLNVSRVANSVGSVALAQRAMADAVDFSEKRLAFGRPVLEHPLLAAQVEERVAGLRRAFALAWESVRLLDEVWGETYPYSERYHLFRLIAHLAKYWTAEMAALTTKWAMEVHGGIGVLKEYAVERWFREAMVLSIWEGTSHRHILDGLEAMERKGAHRLLFDHLSDGADRELLEKMASRVEAHLALSDTEKEGQAEPIFWDLAKFTADALLRKRLAVLSDEES